MAAKKTIKAPAKRATKRTTAKRDDLPRTVSKPSKAARIRQPAVAAAAAVHASAVKVGDVRAAAAALWPEYSGVTVMKESGAYFVKAFGSPRARSEQEIVCVVAEKRGEAFARAKRAIVALA